MRMEINKEYLWAKEFILNIPKNFHRDGIVLEDGRNTIKKTVMGGQWIVVKRYKRPFWFQRFVYSFFRPTKARRAYRFAKSYRDAGFETPTEIAYIEQYEKGLFADGYFVSVISDKACVRSQLSDDNFSRPLAEALAKCIVRMHQHHILHGDLNTSNILYNITSQGEVQFEFIDINRSKFPQKISREQCLNNLKRLSYQRNVLRYIVKAYAEQRRWDTTYCVDYVMNQLDKFEKSKAVHLKIKKAFKLKRC